MPSFDAVNWLAVIVATVIYFGLGAVWYGPLFGKRWAEGMGMVMPEGGSQMPPATLAMQAVLVLLITLGIATVGGGTDLVGAIGAVAWLWLAFVATTLAIGTIWDVRPRFLLWINGGFHLVGMVLVAIILHVWS